MVSEALSKAFFCYFKGEYLVLSLVKTYGKTGYLVLSCALGGPSFAFPLTRAGGEVLEDDLLRWFVDEFAVGDVIALTLDSIWDVMSFYGVWAVFVD